MGSLLFGISFTSQERKISVHVLCFIEDRTSWTCWGVMRWQWSSCFSHRTVILGRGRLWFPDVKKNPQLHEMDQELQVIVSGCCLDNSSCEISRLFVVLFCHHYLFSKRSTLVMKVSNIWICIIPLKKCLDIVNIWSFHRHLHWSGNLDCLNFRVMAVTD